MTRWEARIKKLEEAQPDGTGVWYGLVRYSPPEGASDWLAPMLADLNWSSAAFAMMVVDANDPADTTPVGVIAPAHYDDMIDSDRMRYFAAGRDPGRWYLAITGRGEPEAMAMHGGRAAFIKDMREQINKPQGGYFGQF
ncbi:hypothetical protein [uncultured Sphingomonas sp.]|uniref:hypothetical protein n=1 Tax=uncultured Sphingomonas sp. TaxID=158754 RepID=UPI00260DF7E4|nr:hypothetical protein [uncultured Sphingomonas sp.]